MVDRASRCVTHAWLVFYARCSSLSCGANVVTGLDVNRLNTSREEPWRGKNCFWFACECGQEAIVQYLARETQVDTGGAEAIPVTGEIIYELAAPELRTWIKGSKGFAAALGVRSLLTLHRAHSLPHSSCSLHIHSAPVSLTCTAYRTVRYVASYSSAHSLRLISCC